MPLTGTACALRDFAHAQNHPSDRRPHANVNTPRGCLRQPPSYPRSTVLAASFWFRRPAAHRCSVVCLFCRYV
ncbi:hypothetical protein CTW66_23055 [Salmonella enterica subsp. enterica serovar Gaminara]|nr:hypothetical protein [Salmonella enterica subsp. enterica serovar Gaminara]